MHFAAQYASKGQQALVSVDNEEIRVLTRPADSNPLDFVMTMLQSGRIKEAGLDTGQGLTDCLRDRGKGQQGLDPNDPDQKYTLSTLPGTFSGMHLVSIKYAGMKALDAEIETGIDLKAEYDAALAMRRK